jgi:hypothetical protein
MRSHRLLQVALLAILLVVLVQGCSRAGTRSTASSTSRSDFTAETILYVDELEVRAEMNSNVLTIESIRLDTGQLTLRLVKPDGQIQWEEVHVAPADYQHTFELDVTPGTWRLELELEDATGGYDMQWDASN